MDVACSPHVLRARQQCAGSVCQTMHMPKCRKLRFGNAARRCQQKARMKHFSGAVNAAACVWIACQLRNLRCLMFLTQSIWCLLLEEGPMWCPASALVVHSPIMLAVPSLLHNAVSCLIFSLYPLKGAQCQPSVWSGSRVRILASVEHRRVGLLRQRGLP